MNSRSSLYIATLVVFAVSLSFLPASAAGKLEDMAAHALNCGVSSESVEQIRGLSSAGASEDAAVAVLSPLLNACVDQLPVSPLEIRLSEGVTKRVPLPAISVALEKQLASFRLAREILLTTTGSLNESALEVVGNGVGKGVVRSDFEAFATEFGKQPVEVFLTGLTMVSLQGQIDYDYALTQRILEKGIQAETLSPDWQYFVRVVLAARKHGIEDRIIADAAVDVLDKGEPVSSVLPELGFTDRDLAGGISK